jgi:aspartate oxidase
MHVLARDRTGMHWQVQKGGGFHYYRAEQRGQPLEVAVCAQHNNGGLAGNLWWESVNVKHLFPVGEVNGSHGVYRPGGSALNSGQVAGLRAAEYIANRYGRWDLDRKAAEKSVSASASDLMEWMDKCVDAKTSWKAEREELQARMSRCGAHIRSGAELEKAVAEAWKQWHRVNLSGCSYRTPAELAEALRNRQLCFAQAVYLEAIRFALASGVGSRGSAIALDRNGTRVHEKLGDEWRIVPEDAAFKEKVQETLATADGKVENRWAPRRPLPECSAWFETGWADFRNGDIYEA